MGDIVKCFKNGSYLEYDQGNFDGWCVYLQNAGGSGIPFRDVDCFRKLQSFGKKYGNDKIYNDCVVVYDLTGKQVENGVVAKITEIAAGYGEDSEPLDLELTFLYMAMIAEENRARTKLGKRIKRLGFHMLLKESFSAEDSADYTRGMNWLQIDELCTERGF